MSEAIDVPYEEITEPGQALVTVPTVALVPDVKAGDLVERLNVIEDAMKTAMKEGVDYGRIPGIDKPTLFKPGAEKLGVLFQLDVQIVNEKTWGPEAHLTVISHATVYHAPTGSRLGYGEGVCTTRERKYAYRKSERVCPTCETAAIIKGKKEYGGGWLCWKKRDGCGAKFSDGDPAIESQETGDVDNPDLPDLWNTVVKMAEKRARVDAVLAVTGASALFTQDAEDVKPPAAPAAAPTEAVPSPGTRDAGLLNASQQNLLKARSRRKGVKDVELIQMLKVRFGVEGIENLPVAKLDEAIESLNEPLPTGGSDVPADTEGLIPDEAEPGDDRIPF